MTLLEKISYKSFLAASAMMAFGSKALATNFGTDPCPGGGANLPGCGNVTSNSIVTLIGKILVFVLDLLGIIAVAFIVIAGIRLIVSQGEEEAREKAKKTILYVVIGLIVILFARVIVGFVIGQAPGLLGLS